MWLMHCFTMHKLLNSAWTHCFRFETTNKAAIIQTVCVCRLRGCLCDWESPEGSSEQHEWKTVFHNAGSPELWQLSKSLTVPAHCGFLLPPFWPGFVPWLFQVKKIFENEKRLQAGEHSLDLLAHDFQKNYNMYIFPVHWQFGQLDQHPSDGYVWPRPEQFRVFDFIRLRVRWSRRRADWFPSAAAGRKTLTDPNDLSCWQDDDVAARLKMHQHEHKFTSIFLPLHNNITLN